MIVAQRKNIPDLLAIVKDHKKLLVLGCGTCVTVCLAGGQREVSIIASSGCMDPAVTASPARVCLGDFGYNNAVDGPDTERVAATNGEVGEIHCSVL